MRLKKLNQAGFHAIELLVILVVVGVIVGIGFFVKSKLSQQQNNSALVWTFDTQSNQWQPSKTPPACKDPYAFEYSPVDLNTVTTIGMPGAYRGNNYKAHGGLRLDDTTNGQVDIVLPTDATLVGLTRYYEGDPPELQYVLTFETDCGIAFRFDHLAKLTPEFQAIADKTPEPKMNDTRTNPADNPTPTQFKAGTVVATQVGFANTRNYGFDFGVYDYRQRNQISYNSQWQALHQDYPSQDWYGVCWLNMLPGASSEKANQLSQVWLDTRRSAQIVSDYCPNAQYKTLDINNGQPTSG